MRFLSGYGFNFVIFLWRLLAVVLCTFLLHFNVDCRDVLDVTQEVKNIIKNITRRCRCDDVFLLVKKFSSCILL
jgi:hypothetical protein